MVFCVEWELMVSLFFCRKGGSLIKDHELLNIVYFMYIYVLFQHDWHEW